MPFKLRLFKYVILLVLFLGAFSNYTEAQETVETVVAFEESTGAFGYLDWAAMLGRFHPVVLHFPIGLLMGVFLLELAIVFHRFHNLEPAHWVLLTIATISAIVAAVFGVFLSWEGGYEEEALYWHKWTGIGVAILTVVAFILRFVFIRTWKDGFRTAYRVVLFATIILISIAGHKGGDLTHGSEYLFENMPAWMPMATVNRSGGAGDEASGSHYGETIKPIFESQCYECHGETKIKGEYQMTTRELLLKAGETGIDPVVPGNPFKSELVRLIALPVEHENVMPPKGKGALTGDDIVAIMQWIDHGADFGDGANTIVLEKSKSSSAEIDTSDLDAGGNVSFEMHIWPIIVASCLECHNDEEQEGNLRLDTKEYILEGGEFGSVFEPGSTENSTFYELIVLPEDDPDFMPAKNDPLPDTQIELIKRWIEEGCDFGEWIGE